MTGSASVGMGAVVLSYGQSGRHLPLLKQLEAQGLSPQSTIVVHNPSRPGERPSPASGRVEVLLMPHNLGYASAMNAGLEEAARRGFELALLLTHDTRLGEGALAALGDAAADAPQHGILGLVLEDEGSRSGWSYGGAQERTGHVGHVEELPRGAHGSVLDVPWVDGSAICVRLQAWRDAGPFLEHYFMYFEEAELCTRVRRAGWRVGTALQARATSAAGGSLRPAAYGYLYARNGFDWARREGGSAAAWRFARAQLSSALQTVASATLRHSRDTTTRRALYATAGARLLGLVAAARGRFGPPPPRLAQASDIEGAWQHGAAG